MEKDIKSIVNSLIDISFIEETERMIKQNNESKEQIKNNEWNNYLDPLVTKFSQSWLSKGDIVPFSKVLTNLKINNLTKSDELFSALFNKSGCILKVKKKKGDKEEETIRNIKSVAYTIILDLFPCEFVAFTEENKLFAVNKKINKLFSKKLNVDNWYDASHELYEYLKNAGIFDYLTEEIRPYAINKIGWRLYNYWIDKNKTKGQPANLIFTGAPGTGKTYLAKDLAAKLVAGEDSSYKKLAPKIIEEHIAFVQFHPSYDYSDFVEGLRPIKDETGNIGFERRDGIFKKLCKKAIKNPNCNYVCIIDEINRGEMSKIFGELFYSIDPGYRGTRERISTQYQNLIDYELDENGKKTQIPDLFKDGFYIPKNIYVIGTMNDIDRSVESMDFAMRRRFAFKEIKADDRIDMWNDAGLQDTNDEIKNHMQCLNFAIEQISGFCSAYHVGPSYFLSLKTKDKKYDFIELWNSRLTGLLFEYLRGIPNASELLNKLKTVYDNATALNETKESEIKTLMNT